MNRVRMLGNGVLVTRFPCSGEVRPRIFSRGAIVWRGDRILAVGDEEQLQIDFPGAEFLDARGGLILPGLINLHHHFYSALARALDAGAPLPNFTEILDRFWWRLDRALDAETVRISAQLSVADCTRWGCTTVFDHHSSPSCLPGSLDIIADVLDASGLSGVMCYEVSDRNGHAEALAGIEENVRFLEKHAAHPRIRGIFGLHASFTLRDETLAEVARRRPSAAGCHIHAAEDVLDVDFSRKEFGLGPVERLERFGLLDERCLLAHGIHLQPRDYESIAKRGGVVIHNPESNANNRAGRLDLETVSRSRCCVGLGTDGMSSAMLRSWRAAYLNHCASGNESGNGLRAVSDLLAQNARVARRFFDEPLLGELAPGAPADIIAIDAPPVALLREENLFAHLMFCATEGPVRHTIARGRVLLENFRHTTLDPTALAERAQKVTPALQERFSKLAWGTSFLGEPSVHSRQSR